MNLRFFNRTIVDKGYVYEWFSTLANRSLDKIAQHEREGFTGERVYETFKAVRGYSESFFRNRANNFFGYMVETNKNQKFQEAEEAKTVLHMVQLDNDGSSEVGYGDISYDKAGASAINKNNDYDNMILQSSISSIVSIFLDFNESFKSKGLNLLVAVKYGLEGSKEALETIKEAILLDGTGALEEELLVLLSDEGKEHLYRILEEEGI